MVAPQKRSKEKEIPEDVQTETGIEHPKMETVMSLHSMHCGGACMLKLHVKDGRVCKIRSEERRVG